MVFDWIEWDAKFYNFDSGYGEKAEAFCFTGRTNYTCTGIYVYKERIYIILSISFMCSLNIILSTNSNLFEIEKM